MGTTTASAGAAGPCQEQDHPRVSHFVRLRSSPLGVVWSFQVTSYIYHFSAGTSCTCHHERERLSTYLFGEAWTRAHRPWGYRR